MKKFKPMLIENTKYSVSQLSRLRGMIAQPKIDGVRLALGLTADDRFEYYTRSNEPINKELAGWLELQLCDALKNFTSEYTEIVLDCELLYRGDCASTTGILHSKHINIDYNDIEIFVFDIIINPNTNKDSLLERLTTLRLERLNIESETRPFAVVPFWEHVSHEDSYTRAIDGVNKHNANSSNPMAFEGYVLKPERSMYLQGKRLPYSAKFKVMAEMDVKIVRVLQQHDELGNPLPLAGVLQCTPPYCTQQDTLINVTASCSNALREAIWNKELDVVGRTITIEYFKVQSGLSNTGALRMPRYVSGLEDLCRK